MARDSEAFGHMVGHDLAGGGDVEDLLALLAEEVMVMMEMLALVSGHIVFEADDGEFTGL